MASGILAALLDHSSLLTSRSWNGLVVRSKRLSPGRKVHVHFALVKNVAVLMNVSYDAKIGTGRDG